MAKERAKIEGLRAIDGAIRTLNGIMGSLNERVQEVAVAIIEHGAGAGNGDMSRALTLCKTVKRHRTLNVNFLVAFFRYFGNANVNLAADDGTGKVSLRSKDSKGYRGFDAAGARANNWFEAIDDATGERAAWYAGPMPETYEPDTIGDIADQFERFVERTNKRLDGTKTVGGKEVPLTALSEADEAQVHNALQFISRIAATLKRHEDVELLQKQLAEVTEAANEDDAVIAVIAADKAVA